MSGGSFSYAYQKLYDIEMDKIQKLLEVVSDLMHDVEWVESGDYTWDTELAGIWYRRVKELCCAFDEERTGERCEEKTPVAPAHYPDGEAYCQYCGAAEKHWNEKLKLD